MKIKNNMLGAILLLVVYLSVSGNATNLISDKQLSNIKTAEFGEQRMLDTRKDYMAFEKDILTAFNSGDKSKAFLLGSLYSTEHNLKDGVIPKDTQKALKYFNISLSDGNGLAAFFIALLDEQINQNPDMMLLVLEQGLKSAKNKYSTNVVLAVFYNSIVLDYKSDNIKYVHKALDLTYPISQIKNMSTLDFTIANLLAISGNMEEANQYLNTACSNPEADEVIKNICSSPSFSTNPKQLNSCSQQ